MTDEIINTLSARLDGNIESGARFVFHSETAALFWARRALAVFPAKTIARERFIAWDTFKAENLRAASDRRPVSQVLRLLFAQKLCAENAAAPFFRALIPPAFAEEGLLFARGIAAMLSSLKLWRKKTGEAAVRGVEFSGADYNDFEILEERYTSFLDANNLFEPSWEKPPFKDRARDYYIFYPELLDDFSEYEELLCAPNVFLIHLELKDESDGTKLFLYDSAREELRAAVLELRRLHFEKGIPYEDMALSAGGLENAEAYIKRELQNYHVPFHLRSGKKLSRYSAARFWQLVSDCTGNEFSWNSLEALLTNNALPWRCPNKHRALLSFGIKNSCVSAYREHGKKIDVWLEAFSRIKHNERLFNHYKKLKAKITRIANAKNFDALNKRSRIFFARFFRDTWSTECSNIIGRALSELSALTVLEKRFPAVTAASPLDFFVMILNEKVHVTEAPKKGVAVFDYGVAASIPAAAHIVIGANQNAVTKLRRPLSFLRQDKRAMLEVEDTDMSKSFLKSFFQTIDTNGTKNIFRISAARNSLNGAEIPHSYYNRLNINGEHFIVTAKETGDDPYINEKKWWTAAHADFPAELFPNQHTGFENWRKCAQKPVFNLLHSAIPKESAAYKLISRKIDFVKRKDRKDEKVTDGKLRISATSMNLFFNCAARWLFQSILKLEPYPLRAAIIAGDKRGILYHEVLFAVFKKIKDSGGIFRADNIEQYVEWAREAALCTNVLRGPLRRSLLAGMAEAVARNVGAVLELEAKTRDGWSAVMLEEIRAEERENIILTGTIDRVSLSADYIPVIVDYKSGRLPAKKDCLHSEDMPLADFQMPFYIKLFEASKKKAVECALFIQTIRAETLYIVKQDGRGSINREMYQNTLDALEYFIAEHEKAVNVLDFSPKEPVNSGGAVNFSFRKIPLGRCARCVFKAVCRTRYTT
ncbi:MAG: PD-(D/E)XK nuclease family protein [Spirochaetaceae bacterium]|jgi:hypothetical protein|nr:PD-(D/E)XK nuclease family protein [Spirochaetaceae bacterium]